MKELFSQCKKEFRSLTGLMWMLNSGAEKITGVIENRRLESWLLGQILAWFGWGVGSWYYLTANSRVSHDYGFAAVCLALYSVVVLLAITVRLSSFNRWQEMEGNAYRQFLSSLTIGFGVTILSVVVVCLRVLVVLSVSIVSTPITLRRIIVSYRLTHLKKGLKHR